MATDIKHCTLKYYIITYSASVWPCQVPRVCTVNYVFPLQPPLLKATCNKGSFKYNTCSKDHNRKHESKTIYSAVFTFITQKHTHIFIWLWILQNPKLNLQQHVRLEAFHSPPSDSFQSVEASFLQPRLWVAELPTVPELHSLCLIPAHVLAGWEHWLPTQQLCS